TYGHPAGDKLLETAATFMRAAIGPEDEVFRLAGKQFLIFMQNVKGNELHNVTRNLQVQLDKLKIGVGSGKSVSVRVHMGVARFMKRTEADLESLMTTAQLAVETAKHSQKKRRVVILSRRGSPDHLRAISQAN